MLNRIKNADITELYFLLLGLVFTSFIFFNKATIGLFIDIQMSESILITDYLTIGGLHATFANVGAVLLLNLTIIWISKAKLDGINIAALLTIFGFSFFGKNLINSIPIYLGVFFYARLKHKPFFELIPIMLFSSGLAPVVSFIMFGFESVTVLTVLMATLVGIFSGMVLPEISQTVKPFHDNLNLYNVGFSLGFIAIFVSVILRAFDVDLSSETAVSSMNQTGLWIFLIAMLLSFLILSVLLKPSFNALTSLFKSTGNEGDYIALYGPGTAWLNVFIMGLLSVALILLFNFTINGPLLAGIFTVVGFGTFGKHPFNSLPVITGAIGAVMVTAYSFESVSFVIAIFFVTALAPVSGKYGLIFGLLAGFIHVLITPYAYLLQGGFDLYNNGFAAGFAAMLISSIAKVLKTIHPSFIKKAV